MSKDTSAKAPTKRATKKDAETVAQAAQETLDIAVEKISTEEPATIEAPIKDLPYPDVAEQVDVVTSFIEDWQTNVKNLFSETGDGLTQFQTSLADLKLAGDEITRVVESSRSAATSGFAAVSQVVQTFAKQAFDQNMATSKALLGAHSIPEALEIQHRYMQESFKAFTDHVQELHAISVDVSQKALEPVSESVSKSLARVWTEKAA